MRVMTLVDFHDNAKDVDRRRGEEFVVSRERFDEINAVGQERIGRPIVGEVPEKQAPEERAAKAKATRRSARKAGR